MKQLWILGVAAALLSSSVAMAADAPASPAAVSTAQATGHHRHWPSGPKTRQEAIAREQKRLDKLKAMTDEQWQQQQEKRHASYKNRHNRGELSPSAGTPPAPAAQQ